MRKVVKPKASALIMSMRSIGYSLNNAVADIIDNSISAKASKIDIICNWEGNEPFIEIRDNGVGMDADQLEEAMRLGSDPNNIRDPDDLGRFGLGLKTASFSQAKKLIVRSSNNVSDSIAMWDLDVVARENEWLLDIETSNEGNFLEKQGTVVRWEKIDTLEKKDKKDANRFLEELTSELIKHISLIFHRYISGEDERKVSFTVNGNLCESSDPFFVEKSTKQPVEKIDNCKVTSYTLPHHTHCTEKEFNDHADLGGDEGYLENQGFYLYRRGRLICKSTWFNYCKKSEMRNLCRISIDIENNTDSEWQLDVKKSRATPPPRIRGRLRDLIDTFSRPSAVKYSSRVINKRLANKEKKPIWERVVSNKSKDIIYKISKDNPSITSIFNSLDDDLSQQLENVFSLIEKCMPYPEIAHDYTENPKNLKNEKFSIKELIDLATTTKDFYMKSGKSFEEAYNLLKNLSYLNENWSEIEEHLNNE